MQEKIISASLLLITIISSAIYGCILFSFFFCFPPISYVNNRVESTIIGQNEEMVGPDLELEQIIRIQICIVGPVREAKLQQVPSETILNQFNQFKSSQPYFPNIHFSVTLHLTKTTNN
jgi:hypothetical protein